MRDAPDPDSNVADSERLNRKEHGEDRGEQDGDADTGMDDACLDDDTSGDRGREDECIGGSSTPSPQHLYSR
jgi:hypothetical protein